MELLSYVLTIVAGIVAVLTYLHIRPRDPGINDGRSSDSGVSLTPKIAKAMFRLEKYDEGLNKNSEIKSNEGYLMLLMCGVLVGLFFMNSGKESQDVALERLGSVFVMIPVLLYALIWLKRTALYYYTQYCLRILRLSNEEYCDFIDRAKQSDWYNRDNILQIVNSFYKI